MNYPPREPMLRSAPTRVAAIAFRGGLANVLESHLAKCGARKPPDTPTAELQWRIGSVRAVLAAGSSESIVFETVVLLLLVQMSGSLITARRYWADYRHGLVGMSRTLGAKICKVG